MTMVFLKLAVAIIVADLITGVVHWLEDTYGDPNWKYLGKSVIEPNLLHHKQPRAFLQGSYWQRVNTSFFAGLLLVGVCYVLHILNWYSFFCLALAVHGNEIHRLAHQTNKENGKLVTALQKMGLLQSRRHHSRHHTRPYACGYCIITNYLNPVLDAIRFWTMLEYLALKVLGIKVLRASAARNGV